MTGGRAFATRPAATLLLAAAAMSAGVLLPVQALRTAVVLPIALLAPGYAVLAAQRAPTGLDRPPTVALSALVSIAVHLLLGLGLHAASIRIETASVLAAANSLVVALALVIGVRSWRATRSGNVAARLPSAARSVGGEQRAASAFDGRSGAALFVTIVAIVVGALAVALRLLPSPVAEPYAQLYLAGRWSHVGAPVRSPSSQPLRVDIGVTNRSDARESYRIVPRVDGRHRWRSRVVTADPAEAWLGSVSGRFPGGRCLHRVTIELYRREGRRVASLNLWVREAGTSDADRGRVGVCRREGG